MTPLLKNRILLIASASLLGLMLAACESEKKTHTTTHSAEANGASASRTVSFEPGVAGGTVTQTMTVDVTVAAVDVASRKVTLRDEDGNEASYTVSPAVRNFEQVRAGDKLTAILSQHLAIYVRKAGESDATSGSAYSAAIARAPRGAKPAGIFGESYEIVARVDAIDRKNRVGTLRFADGSTAMVQVRADVKLDRYNVGDTVYIRVDSALAVLTRRP